MIEKYMLESEHATAIEFVLETERRGNRSITRVIVAGSSLGEEFAPHMRTQLVSVNGTKTSGFSLDQVKMEILCAARWPVTLEFAPNNSKPAAKQTQQPSSSSKRQKKAVFTPSLASKRMWDLQDLPPACCTKQEWEALCATNNNNTDAAALPAPLMEELILRVVAGKPKHAGTAWGQETKAYQIADLLTGTQRADFVFLPYEFRQGWNLAILCELAQGQKMVLLRFDADAAATDKSAAAAGQANKSSRQRGAASRKDEEEEYSEEEEEEEDDTLLGDEAFVRMRSKFTQKYGYVDVLSVPTSVYGQGFALLAFASAFTKLVGKAFKNLTRAQEELLTLAWEPPSAQTLVDLRQDVCAALELVVAQEKPKRRDLPPLHAPFPPNTATYRALHEFFERCGEVDFIKGYVRAVPQGFNLAARFSQSSTMSILERRKMVWRECEEYLRTKFSF